MDSSQATERIDCDHENALCVNRESASVVVFSIPRPLDISMIPETMVRFLNGPNAGMIDIDAAEREMPWLIGGTQQVSFASPQNRVITY